MWLFRDRATQLVRDAYKLLLDREPDPGGLKHYNAMMAQGMSKEDFLKALISSAEFRNRVGPIGFFQKYDDIDLIIPLKNFRLQVPACDSFLVPYLLEHRIWESHITNFLRQTLKPSDVFLDIGANIGYFTVLASPLVKEVIAFEPALLSYKYLEANIKLNQLNNITIYKYGLWNEDIKSSISVDPSNITAASVSNGTEQIDCITLDSLT